MWLIEVNTNPCIEEGSQLLKVLLPRMLDDAFKLTIDQLYPQPPAERKDTASAQSEASRKGLRVVKAMSMEIGS